MNDMQIDLESVNCNLCGSDDYQHVYRMPDIHYHSDDWFDIVECRKCGLGFVNPRPTQMSIVRYYPQDFFNVFESNKGECERRYGREAIYLNDVPNPSSGPRRLLDIGCANGGFPRYMKRLGWEVEGVEPAPSANMVDDFLLYKCCFPEIPVERVKYDAITAWAVLEHVHDPMSYFRKAGNVLQPGGRFVFLVTNFNSASSKYLFREDPPRHLYFFTRQNIETYLRLNDFTLEKLDFTDAVFHMRPLNWMRHYCLTMMGCKPMTWNCIPESLKEYSLRKRMTNVALTTVAYAAKHPFAFLDRMLMPLYERWQMMTKTYGIAIYVARKI